MDNLDGENLTGGCDGLKATDASPSFQDYANPTGFLGDPGEERVTPVVGDTGF